MDKTRELILKKSEETKDIPEKVDLLLEYSRLSIFRYYEEGYEALKKAHNLSVENNYKEGEAWSYIRMGSYCINRNETTESIKNYIQALGMMLELENKKGIARSHFYLGTAYSLCGNYELAIEELTIALNLIEKYDKEYYLPLLNNLSKIFIDIQEYEKAQNFLNTALDFEQKNHSDKIYLIYIKLATIQIFKNEYEKGLSYLNLALKEIEDKDIPHYQGMCNMLIARAYKGMKLFSESLIIFKKAIEEYEKGGDLQHLTNVYHDISEIYIEQKDYEKALENAEISLNFSIKRENKFHESKALYLISKIYELIKDYEKAFNYYKKASEIEKEENFKIIKSKYEAFEIKYMMEHENAETIIKNRDIKLKEKEAEIIKKNEKLEYVMKKLEETYKKLLENEKLIALGQLTEAFVEGIVEIVDLRDTATSGHSKRIANYSLKLADAINKNKNSFNEINFNEIELKEIYYSALLHDIGKLGISEKILLKSERITEDQMLMINYRANYIRIYLINKVKEKKMLTQLEEDYYKNFDKYLNFLSEISKKQTLTKEEEQQIKKLSQIKAFDNLNEPIYFLNEENIAQLMTYRGNLTKEEWETIKSHAKLTQDFLKKIPWLQTLKKVPEIASSHHEKLDGSGYPRGLKGDEISIQARILSIVDIFEALTASDRPYKKPFTIEKALEILKEEVKDGKLDKEILNIFIEEKIYKLYEEELKNLQ